MRAVREERVGRAFLTVTEAKVAEEVASEAQVEHAPVQHRPCLLAPHLLGPLEKKGPRTQPTEGTLVALSWRRR